METDDAPDDPSDLTTPPGVEHRLVDLATGVSWGCEVALSNMGNRNKARPVLSMVRDMATRNLAGKPWSVPPTQERRVVLLVDDNPLVLITVEHALRDLGHLVLAAASIADATELFALVSGRVDVLVADLDIADQDGLDLANALRRTAPDLKVVFITASKRELPDETVLRKPTSPHEIATAIHE